MNEGMVQTFRPEKKKDKDKKERKRKEKIILLDNGCYSEKFMK